MVQLSLEKLLVQLGLGSRKECRILVRQGLVEISGKVMEDPFEVLTQLPAELAVNGEMIPARTSLFVMLYKPAGFECSHRPQHHDSVFSLLPARWLNMDMHCVGRLDVDTTGLLLFSNQGRFIHHVESPRKGLGKVYRAHLAESLSSTAQEMLLEGVELRSEKGLFRALSLNAIEDRVVDIAVGEGVYHQVKRMFAAVGNKVESLHRISIGDLKLDPVLCPGQWRFLEEEDLVKIDYHEEVL